jgi:hypothetical protein
MTKATKTVRGAARAARRNAGNRQPVAIIGQQAERVATNMREAFCNIQITGYDAGKRDIVETILTCAKQNAGNNKVGRGWTANLTPQTVRKLTFEGVFA